MNMDSKQNLAIISFLGSVVLTVLLYPSHCLEPDSPAEKIKREPFQISTVGTHCYFLESGPASGNQVSSPRQPVPIDNPTSNDPVERALAQSTTLQERWLPDQKAGRWMRERLVRSVIQSGPLHVREVWELAAHQWISIRREIYLANQVIVQTHPRANIETLINVLTDRGLQLGRNLAENLFIVQLPGNDLDSLSNGLKQIADLSHWVAFSEPDGVGFGGSQPDDYYFDRQWGNHNTGQLSGSTPGADVNASKFWEILQTASSVPIAVLDSGLNVAHPDLLGIAWNNHGEVPEDGIDNDGNGYIDDSNGWDFVNSDRNPSDDHRHGTHVSGIIAADQNNTEGISGMLDGAKILPCKILNSSNSGLTSNLIAATAYARLLGMPIMNLSLQNYPFSNSLDAEFRACEQTGILLCICAGNQGVNNDTTPNYPSSYTHANIIAVGNHDPTDRRYTTSNYGMTQVDLFAPGTNIFSTILGTSYGYMTGTSMATPYVTAVAAAIKSLHPNWSAAEIKACILSSCTERYFYYGICGSGGRLNAASAVAYAIQQSPTADLDKDGYTDLLEYSAGSRTDSPASTPRITSFVTDGYFCVTMSHANRSEIQLDISRSADLSSWSNEGVQSFNSPENIEGRIPIDGSAGRFLRVNIKSAAQSNVAP